MKIPKIIFIIGPSSVGKSKFIEIVLKNNLSFYSITDSLILKEIFLLNLEKEYTTSLVGKIDYSFKEFIIEKDLLKNHFNLDLPSTKYNGDGFDILDPILWDEILIIALKYINSNSFDKNTTLFEFSRGVDKDYLEYFSIKSSDVYFHSFSLIMQFLLNVNITIKDVLIINITASYNKRFFRNKDRKRLGRHYVSEKTLREIYKYDIFNYKKIHEDCGYLSEDLKIPVFEYLNNLDLKENELLKVFSKVYEKSIAFYNNFIEKDY